VILELALVAGVAASVALFRRRQNRKAQAPARVAKESASRKAETKPARRAGLNVSDVILYADTELWLAGVIDLDDGADVLRLFATPGAKRASHVVQLDREGEDVATLSAASKIPAGRVPDELSVDGARLRLRKRGRASVRTEGESLPPHTPHADYVILGDPSGRLVLVIDFVGGERLALAGERVPRGMLDVLPGGS
jgi:hypothetical protein